MLRLSLPLPLKTHRSSSGIAVEASLQGARDASAKASKSIETQPERRRGARFHPLFHFGVIRGQEEMLVVALHELHEELFGAPLDGLQVIRAPDVHRHSAWLQLPDAAFKLWNRPEPTSEGRISPSKRPE